ncbi:ParA family protein [Cardiobacterium valvarum]|uniref:Plasmid-partitioning protein SopA n=1 Tax=Cardiobacterium valvarum TaxID=194702 RepID=A0A381E7E2_9GAMM|nr:ParA family protein [Cardiobacterium valvarum]SUX22597.1 plasmid-partitioning protein SopA [Cardiobacterium valvarum]
MNLNRAQKLSLVSSKGGVGKSTWAINGACALADMGLNVLCIDLDPQGSLSKFFCTPQELRQGPGLVEFVTQSDTSAIRNTLFPRIRLIANNDDGETLNQWMREEFSASFALKTMLARVEGDFDIIVIDTQGKDGRGQLQEMALVASDIVIVPTTPDLISTQELPRSINIYSNVVRGLATMGFTDQPPLLRILINREDHTTETRSAIAAIRKNFGAIARHIAVLRTTIPQRVVWKQCISQRQPAHRLETVRHDPRSAMSVMEAVIHELLPHYADLRLDSSKVPVSSSDTENPTDGLQSPALAAAASNASSRPEAESGYAAQGGHHGQ